MSNEDRFEIVQPGVVKMSAPEFLGGMPIWCETTVVPAPDPAAKLALQEGAEAVSWSVEDAVLAAAFDLFAENDVDTVLAAVQHARDLRRQRFERGLVFSEGYPPDYVHPEPDEVHRTDEADLYRVSRESDGRRIPHLPPRGVCFTTIPVLEFLTGKPWNALALNYVDALRPTSIRVSAPGEGLTCDSSPWRVDVHLAQDERTIERITQEVICGSRGVYHGADLRGRLEGRPFQRDDGLAKVIINTRGIERGVKSTPEDGSPR